MAYKATRQILLGGINDAPTSGASEYAPIVGGGNSSATWASTESWRRVKFPIAGVLSGFKVKIATAPGTGNSVIFTVMKNGSAQSMAITISGTATEGEYTGADLAIAAGDDITIRHTTTGTPTLHSVSSWRSMFVPTATKRCVLLGGTGNGTGDVLTTEYIPLFYNGNGWTTAITGQQSLCSIDGTIRSWRMTLSGAPAATATMTFYIYKNGVQEASSALAFTSGSGTTLSVSGLSIDIAPGDLLAIGCVSAVAVSTARFQRWGVEVEPDNDGESILAGGILGPSTANTLFSFAEDQQAVGASTTESARTGICGPERFTLKNLRVNLSTAPGAGTPSRTVRFRKNSANGSASVALTTGTTGTDASNTDVFDAADTISVTTVPASTPAATTRHAWAAKMVMDWQYFSITAGMDYDVRREASLTKTAAYELATEIYSRGIYGSLPADDANLTTIYTSAERAQVASDNADRVNISLATGDYSIHLYKTKHTDATKNIAVQWNGQSVTAPSTASVVLQIYNQDTAAWETLDTESAAAADTDFTLNGTITANAADYYDAGGWVAVRIYQLAP